MSGEVEVLEDVPDLGREGIDVGPEVLADVGLIPHQLLQVQGTGVVEVLAGLPQEERPRVQPRLRPGRELIEYRLLRGLEDTVEAAEDGERQDDLAVVGLLVVPAEEIRDGPDEGGQIRIGQGYVFPERLPGSSSLCAPKGNAQGPKWGEPRDRGRRDRGTWGAVADHPNTDLSPARLATLHGRFQGAA